MARGDSPVTFSDFLQQYGSASNPIHLLDVGKQSYTFGDFYRPTNITPSYSNFFQATSLPYAFNPMETVALRKAMMLQESVVPTKGTQSGTPSTSSSASPGPTGALIEGNDGVLRWRNEMQNAATRLGVPIDVLAGIMEIESGGDSGAYSVAGATGLMQVMPNFHSHRTAKYGGADLWDPQTNIYVGAEILKENFDMAKQMYGSTDARAWEIAAAAYLGDWDWQAGEFLGAADAYGTTGSAYIDRFNQARQKFAASTTPQVPQVPTSNGIISSTAVTGGQYYPVTQEFGHTDFAASSGFYSGNGHGGYDIGTPSGTALYTPFEGEVVVAGDVGDGYGTKVYLKTSFGFLLLGHLGSVTVSAGQKLSAGSLVGYSGNTGASTGPHLHLGTYDSNGNAMDPSALFSF